MDPKACVERFIQAWHDGDTEEMQFAAEDYSNWIGKGGFACEVKGCKVLWLNEHDANGVPAIAVSFSTMDKYKSTVLDCGVTISDDTLWLNPNQLEEILSLED